MKMKTVIRDIENSEEMYRLSKFFRLMEKLFAICYHFYHANYLMFKTQVKLITFSFSGGEIHS